MAHITRGLAKEMNKHLGKARFVKGIRKYTREQRSVGGTYEEEKNRIEFGPVTEIAKLTTESKERPKVGGTIDVDKIKVYGKDFIRLKTALHNFYGGVWDKNSEADRMTQAIDKTNLRNVLSYNESVGGGRWPGFEYTEHVDTERAKEIWGTDDPEEIAKKLAADLNA